MTRFLILLLLLPLAGQAQDNQFDSAAKYTYSWWCKKYSRPEIPLSHLSEKVFQRYVYESADSQWVALCQQVKTQDSTDDPHYLYWTWNSQKKEWIQTRRGIPPCPYPRTHLDSLEVRIDSLEAKLKRAHVFYSLDSINAEGSWWSHKISFDPEDQ